LTFLQNALTTLALLFLAGVTAGADDPTRVIRDSGISGGLVAQVEVVPLITGEVVCPVRAEDN
jgi:hypothetical protein